MVRRVGESNGGAGHQGDLDDSNTRKPVVSLAHPTTPFPRESPRVLLGRAPEIELHVLVGTRNAIAHVHAAAYRDDRV